MYSSKSNVSLTSAINENIKMVNKQATNITNAQSNISINNIASVGMRQNRVTCYKRNWTKHIIELSQTWIAQ